MNQQAWYLLNIQSRAIRHIYVTFLVIFLNAKYSSWSKIAIIPSPSDKNKTKIPTFPLQGRFIVLVLTMGTKTLTFEKI